MLPAQAYAQSPVTNIVWTVPCAYIYDQPRFPWRGVMLDCARHFFAKQDIKLLLDAMAAVKLNTFHWHLTDDQGWRLEITNYPALTTNSAWRSYMDYGLNIRAAGNLTNSLGQYGGCYSQADAREIVAYAQQLHITVVPEIEMPCHAIAALNAYPQFGCGNPASSYNMDTISTCGTCYGVDLFSPGSPGTMAFLQDVLSETMAIFPGQYIHCGGDEVVASGDTQWNSYSYDVNQMSAVGITPNGSTSIVAYQHWLSTNIAAFVQSKGRTMIGWTEFENGGAIPNAALMDWETGSSSKAVTVAESGQKVVMAPDSNCYINYIESTTGLEPPFIVGGGPSYCSITNVYGFEPIPSSLPAQYDTNILGAQCSLWTEYVPSAENVMFKVFPRACAMAELTWTPAALKTNYSNFLSRLAVHGQRLGQMGVNYDHESIVPVGTWTPGQLLSTSFVTNQWDITTNTTAGEIDVNFWYTNGANSMLIAWASLVENGIEVDRDTHAGLAMNATEKQYATNATLYVLHLPVRKPGATYQIKASVQGSGGVNCSGIVYLPNWN
jgi:hexosaminidase